MEFYQNYRHTTIHDRLYRTTEPLTRKTEVKTKLVSLRRAEKICGTNMDIFTEQSLMLLLAIDR